MTTESGGELLVEAIREALTAWVPPAPDLQLYTPAQAAELLGVTENWVQERIRARRLPFTLIGRFPRFSARHILAITEMGEINPATRRVTRAA
ncbi:helix-turn-helix domain-containing protein [Streptomyces sp. NPDC048507]|uniref:helix-turn-helix domain-containing protein n=1 Tax=Streptomyces sp. NPDC048507 TaxID=3365560 RepID=UPI003718F886